VVGIDDLVANVEVQVRTAHKKAPGRDKGWRRTLSLL
jgi:hypothetical protein